MTQSEILWEAYKIVRDVCEASKSCGIGCPLYETCKDLDIEPHRVIKNLQYDICVRPIFERGN